MKCGEPKPGSSYQTCDKDLFHGGGHTYLGDRWPRLVPDGLDWEVQELLDATAPRSAYGLEERSFPIIVTETITRVLWVDAEDEDHALAYWADDYSEINLRDAEVLDADLEFERPDTHARQAAFRSAHTDRKIGPLVPCPDCGRTAFRQAWFHDPYRKCHGSIVWRMGGHGRPIREYAATPVGGARQAVAV